MQENFGSKPEDLLAAVGPSVCMDCYEVSEDVIEQFKEAFEKKYWEDLFYKKENGKYQLNLWKANELIFLKVESCRSIWQSQMFVHIAIVRSYILIGRWGTTGEICAHFLH